MFWFALQSTISQYNKLDWKSSLNNFCPKWIFPYHSDYIWNHHDVYDTIFEISLNHLHFRSLEDRKMAAINQITVLLSHSISSFKGFAAFNIKKICQYWVTINTILPIIIGCYKAAYDTLLLQICKVAMALYFYHLFKAVNSLLLH